MRKGKTKTVIVLALEIVTIVVLHAIKISQAEKPIREVGKPISSPAQTDAKGKSPYYTLANYSLPRFK
jgi:hypothetical protein